MSSTGVRTAKAPRAFPFGPPGLGVLSLCSLLVGPAQAAGPLQPAIEVQSEAERAAAESQAQIDRTYEATRQLLEEYRATVLELESLRRYDEHLGKMVAAQEQKIASLKTQLDGVALTHREIVPLMARMVASLAQFVELDVPFLLEERRGRVRELAELVDSPDASLAEKYRKIMEAYQVETEYGRTLEAYRGTLPDAGQERAVDFLRLGRLTLIYRSLDGGKAGVWDQAARSWKELPDTYGSSLGQAFRVARKESAPDLLKLPVPAPEAVP